MLQTLSLNSLSLTAIFRLTRKTLMDFGAPRAVPPGTMCLADHAKRFIRTLPPGTMCLADHAKLVRMVVHLVATGLGLWPL